MRKDTKASIDAKISAMTDDNHYGWYQLFQNAGKTNREEVTKYYIEEIGKKYKQPNKLQEVFEKIYSGVGLDLSVTQFRKAKEFLLSIRGKDCNHETISKETYIQRNLYNNSKLYEDKLGRIFGYEVTFVRETRLAPVDLISYNFDDGKLKFSLIELKACNAATIKTPASDLLLRALFEVVTYKAYFEKVMAHNDELATAIHTQLKKAYPDIVFTVEDIKNAEINLIVLAPDYIIAEKDNPLMQSFLKSEIRLLTISEARQFDKKTATVGSNEKLFNIV